MSQAVITKAFTEWKAQQAINNQPITLDEFVFAYIPNLDVSKPISNTETIPAADKIVHRQAVSKSGVVNLHSVVYSVTLGADVGDFDFNWIGLVNKASSTLAMIIHAPVQRKIKNASGQQGNVLVRSMLMEYSAAQSATQITTPAETWQIDFTARLAAMDERQRLENIDVYGLAAFFGTGYLVSKTGTQFYVTKGAGYVAGLRAVLAANQNITVSTKPTKVWLDLSWAGTLTSEWKVQSKITVAASLAGYAESGVQHHVFALASIDASGNITDLRPKGSLDDQVASDALAKHEKSRNHPDATTSEKGFTKLNSAVDSDSEAMAATSKAVKTANDNASGRVSKAGDSMTGTLNQDGVTRLTYNWTALCNDATGNKNYLRKMRGGALDTIWHETVQGGEYRLATGSTDAQEELAISTSTGLRTRGNITSQLGGFYSGNAKKFSFVSADTSDRNATLRLWGNVDRPTVVELGDDAGYHLYSQRNKDGSLLFQANGAGQFSGYLRSSGEVQSSSANSFRISYGDYGTFWRNDGANLYLMLTNKGDANGGFNALRPLRVNLDTGALHTDSPLSVANTITASKEIAAGYSGAFGWANQYSTKAPYFNSYATTGASEYHPVIKQLATITGKNSYAFSMGSLVSSDALSWHLHFKGSGTADINYKWDASGNFSAPGQILPGNYANFDGRYYTKTQSDNGYMPKTGAYTKDESNARYLTDTRLGARNYRLMTKSTMFEIAGNIITGLQIEGEVDGNGDYIVMRPMQKLINGTWYTVAQV